MKWISTMLILAFSCGGEQSAQQANQPTATPESPVEATKKTEAEVAPEADAVPEVEAGKPGLSEPSTCVSECIASRQMQATSIEQIERDCEKSCAVRGD
ncbi:MAG: hypothetical protein JKY56_12735 [Kofleriaceae bacterium]|nr:hypothetical protein [Kofleriaceae bacterium]